MMEEARPALAARCRGFWAYLIKREERRQAIETHRENRLRDIELEHARNAGTTSIIEALSNGGEVIEIEPGGHSRVVRMPERPLPPATHRVIVEGEQRRILEGPSAFGGLTP